MNRTVVLEDQFDLVEAVYEAYLGLEGCENITVAANYEIMAELVKELLKYDDIQVDYIELTPESWDGYDGEFILDIDDEGNLSVFKARFSDGEYVRTYDEDAVVFLVHEDCCHKIVDYSEMYAPFCFSWDLEDGDVLESFVCGECKTLHTYRA